MTTTALAAVWKRPWLLALGAVVLAFSDGAATFLAADASVRYTLPRRAKPPDGEYNLATYQWGPTLRASSYHRDPASHLLPVYLVDGNPAPGPLGLWASAARDRKPWVEISWREPRTVSRVRIESARRGGAPGPTASSYALRCLPPRPEQPTLSIHDAPLSAQHALNCQQALAVRIDWEPSTHAIARVYEIEVRGR